MISLEDELAAIGADPIRLAEERREVFSLFGELRAASYLAVALVTTGVGIVIKNNADRIVLDVTPDGAPSIAVRDEKETDRVRLSQGPGVRSNMSVLDPSGTSRISSSTKSSWRSSRRARICVPRRWPRTPRRPCIGSVTVRA